MVGNRQQSEQLLAKAREFSYLEVTKTEESGEFPPLRGSRKIGTRNRPFFFVWKKTTCM